jgi:hypothetical protein
MCVKRMLRWIEGYIAKHAGSKSVPPRWRRFGEGVEKLVPLTSFDGLIVINWYSNEYLEAENGAVRVWRYSFVNCSVKADLAITQLYNSCGDSELHVTFRHSSPKAVSAVETINHAPSGSQQLEQTSRNMDWLQTYGFLPNYYTRR